MLLLCVHALIDLDPLEMTRLVIAPVHEPDESSHTARAKNVDLIAVFSVSEHHNNFAIYPNNFSQFVFLS